MNSSVQYCERPIDSLLLRGKDVMDFLQRLSTNDLSSCPPGEYRQTVFVDEKAKIIDVATVIPLEDKVLLIFNKGNASMLRAWLEKFIFLEDVDVDQQNVACSMISVFGESSASRISSVLNMPLNFRGDRSLISCEYAQNVFLMFINRLGSLPLLNIFSFGTVDSLRHHASSAGAEELSTDDFNIMRIEQGVGIFGNEITRESNPLEVGLERLVSGTKGCYIGQEVIARLQTYDKVQKHLSGFFFDADQNADIAAGKVYSRDQEVGWTTSHAWSTTLQKHIALGFLKSHLSIDNLSFLTNDLSLKCRAEISSLPFVEMKYA